MNKQVMFEYMVPTEYSKCIYTTSKMWGLKKAKMKTFDKRWMR